MPSKDIRVFYSYSHKDEKLRDRLESHLALLKREGIISQWHDRRIGAGTEWRSAISEQLDASHIVLLLISSDFLASEYCYDIEMKRAMELHELGNTRVIPIILRPCDWKLAPFAKVNALPTDGRPVIHWRDHDTAFTDIARGIRDAINSLRIKGLEVELEQEKRKPRIIVADDEQVISNTLTIILNQAGYTAKAVYSGEKTIEAAETFKPDMIISDVIMTGMTGIESAIRIREMFPKCKIILISGQKATADLLEKAREQGHEFEILAKPVHPTDLLQKLRSPSPRAR